AVTRSNRYTEGLIGLGDSYVINTADHHLYDTVMELTNGKGANADIDSVGGSSGYDLAFCVRPNGNFITIGLLSGVQVNCEDSVNKAKVKSKIYHLRNRNKNVSTNKWQAAFHNIITLIKNNQLRLMEMDSKYDLLKVKEAVNVVE